MPPDLSTLPEVQAGLRLFDLLGIFAFGPQLHRLGGVLSFFDTAGQAHRGRIKKIRPPMV